MNKLHANNYQIYYKNSDIKVRTNYQNLHHIVKTAAGGREALDILMEDNDLDLMLVDVFMPEMDGYSLLRVFKQACTREIPTISMFIFKKSFDL